MPDAARDLDTASLGAVLKTALDAVVVMRLDGTVPASSARWKAVSPSIVESPIKTEVHHHEQNAASTAGGVDA